MSADMPVVETDVLVVGSGPAGAAAGLFLATYGSRVLIVTRYGLMQAAQARGASLLPTWRARANRPVRFAA